MKEAPKVGTTGEQRFVVESKHAIDFAVDGMPEVLSSPWLIWFMEHAAREAMLPLLEPGESTVGTQIDIQHLAPTSVGGEVVCSARVVFSEGRSVSFQIEARDRHEVIAKGFHRLQVIQVDRFARRLAAKQ